MQGQQFYEVQRRECINIDSMIPKNHILRQIHENVDLSFIRELTIPCYCLDNGRPSVDPEVFFRMNLIGYLFGIPSDRKLCEAIYYNIAYRWFCRLNLTDEVPNHSSLTKIRDRLSVNVFEQIFTQIVKQCQNLGLVTGKRVMTDSTLFPANASLDSLAPRDPNVQENIKEGTVPGIISPKARKLRNKTHISSTDPDATLAYKRGDKRGLKYKGHISIDAASRVILGIEVTTGAVHETQRYENQLADIQVKYNLNIEEAVADRGYGSAEIIKSLTDKGIITYIPLFSSRSGMSALGKDAGFSYNIEENYCICPAGNKLLQSTYIHSNMARYALSEKVCSICEIKQECKARFKAPNNQNIRVIYRNIYQDLFDTVKTAMKTEKFRQALSERMWKTEGVISEIKLQHGLNRAKYRGISKVQIQAYLAAATINIKRIIAFFMAILCLILMKLKQALVLALLGTSERVITRKLKGNRKHSLRQIINHAT
jgi:transposase